MSEQLTVPASPSRVCAGVVGDVARPVRVLGATLPVADLEVFFRDPDLACVAVRDEDDERVGLITRARLRAAMAGLLGFGRSELLRRPIGDIADRAPLVVGPEAPVADVAMRAMDRASERRFDDVLVRGAAWGSVSTSDLVVALVGSLAAPSAYDPLTRLPGRVATAHALARRCELAAATGSRVVLALLDVRGMTATNARYGLTAGDAVLVELAGRILAALPEECEAGRLDGDRFAVLATLPPVADLHVAAEAEGLRQRLVASLATSSGGIPASAWPWLHSSVVWSTAAGADPQALLLEAEDRLRRAKADAVRSTVSPAVAGVAVRPAAVQAAMLPTQRQY